MDRETADYLERWIEDISDQIPLERAILFGSRASDDYLRSSDVDVILVSESFQGVAWPNRAKDLYLSWRGPHDPEFLCYTSEEFEEKRAQIGIVQTASENGIDLLASA